MNFPDFQIPVPANPPDAGSLIYVTFGQDWIPALLTVLDVMRADGFFLSAPSDIQEQIDELDARLQTFVIVSPQKYPDYAIHFHRESALIHGTNIIWGADSAQDFAGYWAQGTPAIDDEFAFHVFLDAGNYTLTRLGLKAAGQGIMTFTSEEGRTAQIDAYNATTVKNSIIQTGFVFDTPGVHTIHVKMHTKNASATNYFCSFDYLSFLKV